MNHPYAQTDGALTFPVSVPEDLELIERLVTASAASADTAWRRDSTAFLERLYQLLGAATVPDRPAAPTSIAVTGADLHRIKLTVGRINLRFLDPDEHDLPEAGRLLLRRLNVALGRARALRQMACTPATHTPAPRHALGQRPTA
ncbi:hypothetical protein ACFXP3_10300 [Streptomyces sp. NPDC059096]|uniref:hypothetical protein n=1 Tax=Streptomyces sp. NPDC059096 TaxID=3346727 RepID=UPI0036BB572B